MAESFVKVDNTGTSFVGPDATRLYRANVIRQSISFHKKTGMIPTRGMTITKLFALATGITGKPYKRGDHDKAYADLTTWINTMIAALPVIGDKK